MTEFHAGNTKDPAALNRRTFVSVCSLTNWVSVGLGFYFTVNWPVRFSWWLVPVAATAILVSFAALKKFIRYSRNLQARLLAVAAVSMSFVIWVAFPLLIILFGFLQVRYPGFMHSLSHQKAGGNVAIGFVLFLFSPTYLSMFAHMRASKTE